MKNYKIIFFSFLMVCTSLYSEGMETIRCIDKWVTCLSRNGGMVLASALVILYVTDDFEEDSDSEELYSYPLPQKKEDSILTIAKKDACKDIQRIAKKPEEKKDLLPEDKDDMAIFAELFPLGLLYELSNAF